MAVEGYDDTEGVVKPEHLSPAASELRARVDEEFRIAERLDSKSRQTFALAAGFFVVAQTAAFSGFAAQRIDGPERVVTIVLAVLAALAVSWTAHRLADGEEPLGEDDVRPEAIRQWVGAADHPDYVVVRLVAALSETARSRAESNKRRVAAHGRVQQAARTALILTTAELVIAFIARI